MTGFLVMNVLEDAVDERGQASIISRNAVRRFATCSSA